jgi:hypothetical protein
MERYRDVHTKKEGSRTHFRLMTPGDEFVKKLERFIGGTTNRPMKTRRSRMLFTVHTRSIEICPRAPLALHCQTADPAELQHRYFLAVEKGNNESLRGATSPGRG